MDKPKVLIIGASGLVGEEILKTTEGMGQKIVTLSRRKLISKNQDTEEIIINFDDLQLSDIPKVNHVYIALGTELDTSELIYIKKSRRKGFRKVDYEYVTKIAKMAHGNGAESISVVSAVGANKSSRNLYLKTKGEMEEKIISIGYNKTVFAQPGHLLGKRLLKKIRPEVPIMEFGARILKPLMIGPLEDLKFIKASLVAKSMVKHMNIPTDKIVRLKYKELIDI
ncbi:hypothetical protein N9F19_03470 [Gammaproteobacteria bacterium]|nr:hypothetical protein [Gammaproteobacteria bacterium]